MAEPNLLSFYFEFLTIVPYVNDDDPASQEDDCLICKEPFNLWRISTDTMNRPVRLPCGHVFGVQCFAQWMFSPGFQGRCPLCHIVVVDPSQPKARHLFLTEAITTLETLRLLRDGIAARKKKRFIRIFETLVEWRLANKSLYPELQHRDRLMMLWGELLNSICNCPSEPVPAVAPQPDEVAPQLNEVPPQHNEVPPQLNEVPPQPNEVPPFLNQRV